MAGFLSLSLLPPYLHSFFFSFFLLLVSGQDCNTFEELSFSLEFILSWIKFKTHSNAKNLHLLLQVLSVSDTVSLLLVPCQAWPWHGKATLSSCPGESRLWKQRDSNYKHASMLLSHLPFTALPQSNQGWMSSEGLGPHGQENLSEPFVLDLGPFITHHHH